MSTKKPITLSGVMFTATNAAEAAIPAESRALIERHDELHRAWAKNWRDPLPAELKAAQAAVAADPFANYCMELRRQGNEQSHAEWKVAQSPTPA